jgi:hypothetical protein
MKVRSILACAVAALVSSGCATIVARSSQEITITSVPEGAAVKINDKSGAAVHSGSTPLTVALKKGRGYFKAERTPCTSQGRLPHARDVIVEGAMNGWYSEVSTTLDALKVSRHGSELTLTVTEVVGQLVPISNN